jgi:predicted nuclease of predicted toxin-antitoxin system
MKFLLDQNIERRLAAFLKDHGHDVTVVGVDYEAGISDADVLAHSFKERRLLITNDKGDFGDLIFRYHQPHAGVILFRRMRSGIVSIKQSRLSFVLRKYAGNLHHFFVVTPTSIRARKTPQPKAA